MTAPREFNEYVGPCAEEGYTDPQGRRWIRVPWVGWRLAPPSPYLDHRPRRRLLKPSTWRSR